MDNDELESAGRMSEDVFIRQMRRRRHYLDLSQAEVAERVAKLGGSLYQQTIAKIESGQRAVRLQEADLIAQSLGSTVSELLSEAIDDPTASPEAMDVEELITRVRASQRRRDEMDARLQAARQAEEEARQQLQTAEFRATQASLEAQRLAAHHREIEAELRYLSRISLNRQSELNARLGPRWREKIAVRRPITAELLTEQNRYVELLRELTENATEMNSRDRDALLSAVEAMRARLEQWGKGEQ